MVTIVRTLVRARLDVSELFRDPSARRAAGERPELAGKVDLVVVAAGHSQIGERGRAAGGHAALQQSARPVEAHDPGGNLGREPGLGRETAAEVPGAPADFSGETRHGDAPRRLVDLALSHGWSWPAGTGSSAASTTPLIRALHSRQPGDTWREPPRIWLPMTAP